jgi:NitT/TauT family transport system substrate-binding protein
VTVASVGADWTVELPTMVARDMGFWEDEGLDVEITVVGPGQAHVAALIGRGFDFSMNLSTDTLMVAHAAGEEVYAISGAMNKPIHGLFGRVDSVEELAGKSIITDAPGSSSELLVTDILAHYGVSRDDVQWVPISGAAAERVQAVISGVGDAALTTLVEEPRLRAEGLQVLGTVEEVLPVYQWAVMAAHGDLLEEHPDTVVAFLKGLNRAWEFIQDPANDDEMLRILQENGTNVPTDTWDESIDLQRELYTVDGSLDIEGVAAVAERAQAADRVPADYDYNEMLRLEFLEEAQDALGS